MAAQQNGGQSSAPPIPSWLTPYPGASPAVQVTGMNSEASYTTSAKPADVVEHFRKLFATAGVPFLPNPDGMGTAIRAVAPECDLLILVHEQRNGTFVDVNCSAKEASSSAQPAKEIEVMTSGPGRAQTPPRPGSAGARPRPASLPARSVSLPPSASEMQARHAEMVKQLGIHPEYRDAPAPPLVWPSWLVHINSTRLRIEQGVDQSKKAYLEARYTSTEPMSAIYQFYRELLDSNEYRVHNSELSTGQTISGVRQNANGYVEGTNYPDGAPGPRTVIRVSFSRSVLNEPITVRIRFTAYEFVAKPR